jgi:subtilase family serine protease
VVYAAGTKPQQDPTGAWELEEALDIDVAHALAPQATVYLVEAASNDNADLLVAERVAAQLVAAAGGGEVSNSWIGSETANEEQTEADFSRASVVFFAAAGDKAGVGWPSVLSNVVAVGGTAISRQQNGDFADQSAWVDTGGGSSAYVQRPSYQDEIAKIVGPKRGVPDMSLDAAPASGAWVYDTTPYNGKTLGWVVAGGTSLASPASAALVNNAAHFFKSTPLELAQVYAARRKARAFTDIVLGYCGANGQMTNAVKGWDFCTGVGTALGTADK